MPPMPTMHDFTMDKKVLEALSDADKIRLLCVFISNKNGFQFDWDAAAERYGCKPSSMSTISSRVINKIKKGAGSGTGSPATPSGKGAGSKSGAVKKTPQKRKDLKNDDESPKTPNKKMKGEEKAQENESDDELYALDFDGNFGDISFD